MSFLDNPKTKQIGSIALAVVSVGVLCYMLAMHTIFAEESLEDISRRTNAIDSESGKVFRKLRTAEGMSWPMKNPETGKNTLYPVEYCYWTRDGKAKIEPTFVLLNELVGKKEKTICPDCGRVVVPHNPMPPIELMKQASEDAGLIKPDGQ